MTYISNSPFTETEFRQWKQAMEKAGLPLVERETLVTKEEKIRKALNYKYNNEEIDAMVIKNRKERLDKEDPHINLALELSQVVGQLENYRRLHDRATQEKSDKKDKTERVAKYKEMVDLLKVEQKMLQDLQAKRYAENDVSDKLEEFNIKGKVRQQDIDSQAGAAAKALDKYDMSNPFSRRYSQPQTIWKTDTGSSPTARQYLYTDYT